MFWFGSSDLVLIFVQVNNVNCGRLWISYFCLFLLMLPGKYNTTSNYATHSIKTKRLYSQKITTTPSAVSHPSPEAKKLSSKPKILPPVLCAIIPCSLNTWNHDRLNAINRIYTPNQQGERGHNTKTSIRQVTSYTGRGTWRTHENNIKAHEMNDLLVEDEDDGK